MRLSLCRRVCHGALLSILMAAGCSDNPSKPANGPPIACFSVNPGSGTPEMQFQVNASCSTDPQDASTALQVRWDWEGDGAWDTGFSTTKTASHRYATVGTKTIKVEVRDVGNLTASASRTVGVVAGDPAGMVLIEPGTFIMGSPEDEPVRNPDETQHHVTLTRAFYLCDHEVTQSEWRAVMGWHHSSFSGDSLPEESMTWFDCIKYCNLRSAREGLDSVYAMTGRAYDGLHIVAASLATPTWTKNGYRLPTEAEWECACRAGSTTALCTGSITNLVCDPVDPNLDPVGWYCGNASSTPQDVKTKQPNYWALYDMHGNVEEWCWDWSDGVDYGSGAVTDPTGLPSGTYRAARGGNWSGDAFNCRSAARFAAEPGRRLNIVGLRLARTAG